MVNTIGTAKDVVRELGGIETTAKILGVGYTAVSNMQQRGAFPPRHWPALVRHATERGLNTITLSFLEALLAPIDKRSKKPRGRQRPPRAKRVASAC